MEITAVMDRVKKEAMMDLALKVGKHVYRRNRVVTNVKASGEVQLGYGIKKLDGKYFQVLESLKPTSTGDRLSSPPEFVFCTKPNMEEK